MYYYSGLIPRLPCSERKHSNCEGGGEASILTHVSDVKDREMVDLHVGIPGGLEEQK